jgi:Ca2+-dependent lipid-binding protein
LLEVFDWNQIEQAKLLGSGKIELADLEPLEAAERTIALSHQKHGDHGEIRIRVLFTPEIIAKTRKNTSTFSTAGRTVTQIGSLPVGAGKGVIHGVGKVGNKVSGVLGHHRSKQDSVPEAEVPGSPEPPSGQVSGPVGSSDATNANGVSTGQSQPMSAPASAANGGAVDFPTEPGTLRVTVLSAKDLAAQDGDSVKPYVVLRVGEKEHKTKHASKTNAPEW